MGFVRCGIRYCTRRNGDTDVDSAIDHIVCSGLRRSRLQGGWVHQGSPWVLVSDHYPVFAEFKFESGLYGRVLSGRRVAAAVKRAADLQMIRKDRIKEYQEKMREWSLEEEWVQREAGDALLAAALEIGGGDE